MAGFATTRWSLIAASRGEEPRARAALSELLQDYRGALLAYVVHQGHAPDVAEDLVQGFLAQWLERDFHHRVDPERGGFRAWLVTALRNYLLTVAAAEQAQKRGGGRAAVDIALAGSELPADSDPEEEFDRAWAREILRHALRRLRAEAEARGRQELFEVLSPFLAEAPDADDYARAAARLGLRPNTVAVAVRRLRLRLQALIRDAVSDTVDSPEALAHELQVLKRGLVR
jgi:RNA polymerase sigma factor (sigma-70 family)